jgi:spore maturation protein CgeB
MRIFFASDTSPSEFFASSIWENNLYWPLVDLGHDVVRFDYDLRETFQNLMPEVPESKAFIDQNRPKLSAELLRQIRAAHAEKPVDLFLSYFYDACVLPEAIDEIRSMRIRTVNWYCNGSYQLYLVSEISPHYDWCLVPEKSRLKDYVAMGAHPIYCQEAANPNFYKPYRLPIEYDVSFIGQAYGDRPAYIKHLMDRGIDVRVWGPGWPRSSSTTGPVLPARPTRMPAPSVSPERALRIGRKLLTAQGWRTAALRLSQLMNNGSRLEAVKSLTDEAVIYGGGVLSDTEMVKMYSRSKINLGFSTCGNTHLSEERITQVRLRDFEVPMSGGFYMVEYMEELEEFYEIGEEVVCYTNMQDLGDKIEYYLRHDRERETIRRAGYERCLRDHSWHKRFATAFQQMGLS